MYVLSCYSCGEVFKDWGFAFQCPHGCNSLVHTKYPGKFSPKGEGLRRYSFWMPFEVDGDLPVLVKSEEFSEITDAEVFFVVHAYWPEMGVRLKTCSFKEVEALSSLRYSENFAEAIALASVGNTANAFIEHAKKFDIKVYLFVPEKVFSDLFEIERSENITVVKVKGSYDDAQKFARMFSEKKRCKFEGGGRNFARRDALATSCYVYFEKFKEMPDYYVQPIGSGTGVVAFYEGYRRISKEFNVKKPKIIVVQNEPFTPVVDAWKKRSREINSYDDPLDKLYAKVLSNRNPLYGMKGGLYDILSDTEGEAIGISEAEAKRVGKIFKKEFGISLHPAAEVGLAALEKINAKGKILVNITGAGLDRLKKDYKLRKVKEDFVISSEDDLEMIE